MSVRRQLGTAGPAIFPLCLGTNVFGWSADRATSFAVIDAYVAGGGNFLDTANVYSAWAPGNHGGESETIIGQWLRSRGRPADLVIATKVGMAGAGLEEGLRPEQIERGIEDSLRRLGVDRVDLYYAHQDDPATPQEETLAAFAGLVADGRVGALAVSNMPAGRIERSLDICAERGWPGYVAVQPQYNAVDRDDYEGELEAACKRRGLGVATYFSLARGFLAGGYRPDRPLPASPRAAGVTSRYLGDPRATRVLAAVDAVAATHGASPAQVALAWLLARPSVTAAIASATRPHQLTELLDAVDLTLTDAEIEELTAAGR